MTVNAKLLDSLGNAITAANALPVQIPAGVTLTGEVEVKNDSGNPVPVSATALPLPTGAATETTLAGVRTDLGTDGATPPTIPGTGVRGWLRSIYDTLKATLTIQGTVTANAGTGNFTVTQATAANLNATVSGTVSANQSGTWNVNNVTGTVSLPTGAATAANQTNVQSAAGTPNAVAMTVQGNSGGVPLPVSGTVNAAVSGTVTANQGAAGAAAWPVNANQSGSWSVTANAGTGNFTVAQATAANLQATVTQAAGSQGTTAANPFFEAPSIGGAAVSVANPMPVARVADDLCVNATGAAAAAVTLTIPAVAGQFHYIDAIEITLYSTAARTGAAAPVTVTSTNLPGSPTWLFETAGAIGTAIRYSLSANCAMKSAAANTATTIVCPAVTGGLWNVKAVYRAGA